jgi:hypothetical protein
MTNMKVDQNGNHTQSLKYNQHSTHYIRGTLSMRKSIVKGTEFVSF